MFIDISKVEILKEPGCTHTDEGWLDSEGLMLAAYD